MIQNVNRFLITVPFIKNVIFLTIHKKLKNFRHFFTQFKEFIEFLCLSNQAYTHNQILTVIRMNWNMRITLLFAHFFEFIINQVNILNYEFSTHLQIR